MIDRRDIWDQTVRDLAARNEAVTLRAELDSGRSGADVRLRLLSVTDDGTMLVERPEGPYAAPGLTPGVDVTVLIMVDGQRWQGSSRLGDPVQHALNEHHTVRAWPIPPVEEIQSAQRRAFFRADCGGVDLEPVELQPIDAEGAAGEPIAAHLVNISGGGMGLTVPLDPALLNRLRGTPRYRCTLLLPHIELGPILVDAELVHLRRTADDLAYLGMTFTPEHAFAQRQLEDTIVRFTTWLQREHIRRERRGA